MHKVVDFLEKLGLSKYESNAYFGLKELGATTVKELAQHIGLQRANTHFIVQDLIKKGLVYQTMKGARRQIIAEDPERLGYMLDQQVAEKLELKDQLPQIAGILSKISPIADNESTQFKFYEGVEAVKGIYEESLKSEEVHSIVNIDKYYRVFPNSEKMFKKAFEKNPNRIVRTITLDTPKAREVDEDEKMKFPNYQCKYMSEFRHYDIFDYAEYLIYDQKVAIVQLDPGKIVGTIIQSPVINASMKALHNFIWDILDDE